MNSSVTFIDVQNRWNVPDWRNVEGYDYINKLSADATRWEFLRRTWFYRNNWDSGDYSANLDFGLKEMLDPITPGNCPEKNFSFLDSDALGKPLTFDFASVDKELLNRDSENELDSLVGEWVIGLLRRKYALFVFDPNIKIDIQIKRAEYLLRKLKKKRMNKPKEDGKTITLLRVMDAYHENGYYIKTSANKPSKKIVATFELPALKKITPKIDIAREIFKGLGGVTGKTTDEAYSQALNRANRSNFGLRN